MTWRNRTIDRATNEQVARRVCRDPEETYGPRFQQRVLTIVDAATGQIVARYRKGKERTA